MSRSNHHSQKNSPAPGFFRERLARFAVAAFCGLALLTASNRVVVADIFVLANDGQVQGDVIIPPEKQPGKVVVRTADGQITLDKSQIKQIIPQSAAELEYERIRPTFADTVDDQWRLSEWCRDHSLSKQRQVHLERILVLDPDHQRARALLGYSHVDGRWVRQEDAMKEKGFVLYKGQWKLPQEIELLENRRKEELAEKDWFAKIKRWRTALDNRPDRAEALQDELAAINDPAAVPALSQLAINDSDSHVRMSVLGQLVNIGSGSAITLVVARTLGDASEEIRWSALDKLVAAHHPEVVSVYVQALKSKDNVRVNRAAFCLGKLRDKSAIGPLIDALRTTHKFIENPDAQPGQMTTTFGRGASSSGGGGLSVGGGPKVVKMTLENQEVLAALLSLVGNSANFQFDQKAWRVWWAGQRKPILIDARRD
jgi:hypothetical protein